MGSLTTEGEHRTVQGDRRMITLQALNDKGCSVIVFYGVVASR